ncbi:MAG: hypothetical protein O2779_03080 [Nanoarchaeota archaeon]|nr:hypothetical protein [Nanoarchaeota archaeon]
MFEITFYYRKLDSFDIGELVRVWNVGSSTNPVFPKGGSLVRAGLIANDGTGNPLLIARKQGANAGDVEVCHPSEIGEEYLSGSNNRLGDIIIYASSQFIRYVEGADNQEYHYLSSQLSKYRLNPVGEEIRP